MPYKSAETKAKALRNLVKAPKGDSEHLQKARAKSLLARERKQTFKQLVYTILNTKGQEKLRKLAQATVKRAIEGDPTAFKYLVDQLWPVSKDVSASMPEVRVGIRLEGVDGSRVDAAVALGARVSGATSERSGEVEGTSPPKDVELVDDGDAS